MCFSANMSLMLGSAGLVASSVTFLDRSEPMWVRVARGYAIMHFSIMEFIQYFAYPVADQCGYGTNLLLSEISTYHISLQALAIMPALASYSSDKGALKKSALLGLCLSASFLLFNFLPTHWRLFDRSANFIGDFVSCIFMGQYHVGYTISSAFGLLITWGSFFGLAVSGFLWRDNWKIASYHFVGAVLGLFIPQWVFGVSTGEAAAIYCFYSIPITISFLPCFKKFFTAESTHTQKEFA